METLPAVARDIEQIVSLAALAMYWARAGDAFATRRALAGISLGADVLCGRIDADFVTPEDDLEHAYNTLLRCVDLDDARDGAPK